MDTDKLLVIDLSSTDPLERGRVYGEKAKALIAEVVDHWRSDLGSFFSMNENIAVVDVDAYLDKFISETNYIEAIRKWTPDLLDEVRGIAQGSGQSFNTIYALQLLDEEWLFGLRNRLGKPTSKCTAFGILDNSAGLCFSGQNMDVPAWVEGRQVLLRIAANETSPECLVFSIAGTIGVNGLNANGLGITCNTLTQLKYSLDGLPVLYIVRKILQQNSIELAEKILLAIQHASGQNYILSSKSRLRCYECSSTSIVRYSPTEDGSRIFHTNHPLINDNENSLIQGDKRCYINTKSRLDSISGRLGDPSKSPELSDIKAALAAHDDPDNPVSRVLAQCLQCNSIGYTAGASIYELGDTPRFHFASGPPCETEFRTFDFIANDEARGG